MALSRMLAAAVLAAALAVPATAAAAHRPADSHPAKRAATPRVKEQTPLAAAAAAGRRYWGTAPCNGQVKVVAQQRPPAGLDPSSDAWVTFDSPLGANNLAAPASSYTNCTISFASRRWPTPASMHEDWAILCATMTHELGHLLGHDHDAAQGSVMTSVFSDLASVPQLCRAVRPGPRRRS